MTQLLCPVGRPFGPQIEGWQMQHSLPGKEHQTGTLVHHSRIRTRMLSVATVSAANIPAQHESMLSLS